MDVRHTLTLCIHLCRGYTALIVLMQAEHEKKPDGMDVITLPEGPHFHVSIVAVRNADETSTNFLQVLDIKLGAWVR
jgi:predicted transcriptional regulator YdeE